MGQLATVLLKELTQNYNLTIHLGLAYNLKSLKLNPRELIFQIFGLFVCLNIFYCRIIFTYKAIMKHC